MNICVFCSSSNAIDDSFFKDAGLLGELIGKRGHSLINGGANVGLMETVTISAKNAGATTTGVIPEMMKQRDLLSNHSHRVEITNDMMARKARMRELSDAFIALPGGFGTLEEILEVITLKQLDYHRKPIVFINTGGFFNNLFAQFDHSFSQNFAKPEYRQLFQICDTPAEAMEFIEKYIPGAAVNKWYRVPEGNRS